MNIKQALDVHLSQLFSGRIYPDHLPQTPSYPAVTHLRVGTGRSKNFCGTERNVVSSFQIDAWALTYGEAEETAQQVRDLMIDFKGQMGGSPGVMVFDTAITTDIDLSDLEPGVYRVSMTYDINHAE